MKASKLIGSCIIFILFLGLFGCSNKTLQSDNSKQQNNNQIQSSETDQIDNGSQANSGQSKDNVGDINSTTQNNNSNESGSANESKSSQVTTNKPSQTQQEALNEIGTVLKTRVPLMLPVNVPVEKGKYLTATTISQTWYYKVNLYQSNQPESIDSKASSKGDLIATVEGTEYKDTASAKGAINGYTQVDASKYPDMAVDLGHNIIAIGEGATGHAFLTWNEGRWCIRLDSPSDTTYKNKKYPDSKQLAKNIVTYLNNYMLPAPQRIGVISIDNWYNSHGTTIQWQYNQMVYQVWSQDPMTALKVAVAMKFK